MSTYLVATTKPWNIEAFEQNAQHLPGTWHMISRKEELTMETLGQINPEFIFFPHWSWIVPEDILQNYTCVCFHMTDVPYGRGGSPLQNLITRGHTETKLTALKMTNELDAGPVYLKKDLKLDGRAEDIFKRMSCLVYDMVHEIINEDITPKEQTGTPVLFERRTPDMSELPKNQSLQDVYDHIRMLDAPAYPHAFVEYGDYIIEFKNAELSSSDTLCADVKIRKKNA